MLGGGPGWTAPSKDRIIWSYGFISQRRHRSSAIFGDNFEPELYEELLADAQTAIYEGNIRRGALDMA